MPHAGQGSQLGGWLLGLGFSIFFSDWGLTSALVQEETVTCTATPTAMAPSNVFEIFMAFRFSVIEYCFCFKDVA